MADVRIGTKLLGGGREKRREEERREQPHAGALAASTALQALGSPRDALRPDPELGADLVGRQRSRTPPRAVDACHPPRVSGGGVAAAGAEERRDGTGRARL